MDIKDRKGFTLVELIVVMAITVILSGMVYTLIVSGSRSYRAIYDDTEAYNEARAAMSYITVRIRQHDASGSVDAVEITGMTQPSGLPVNALMIREADGRFLWIYCGKNQDGKGMLKEQWGQVFNPGAGRDIAEIYSFIVEKTGNTFSIEIEYNNGKVISKLRESITLRSE